MRCRSSIPPEVVVLAAILAVAAVLRSICRTFPVLVGRCIIGAPVVALAALLAPPRLFLKFCSNFLEQPFERIARVAWWVFWASTSWAWGPFAAASYVLERWGLSKRRARTDNLTKEWLLVGLLFGPYVLVLVGRIIALLCVYYYLWIPVVLSVSTIWWACSGVGSFLPKLEVRLRKCIGILLGYAPEWAVQFVADSIRDLYAKPNRQHFPLPRRFKALYKVERPKLLAWIHERFLVEPYLRTNPPTRPCRQNRAKHNRELRSALRRSAPRCSSCSDEPAMPETLGANSALRSLRLTCAGAFAN